MSPTIKRLVCAAVVFLCGVAATVWADEAPTHRPAFSLEESSRRVPRVSLYSLQTALPLSFNYASRYFGHPLFPDFGNDNNLFLVSLQTGERPPIDFRHASKDLPRVLTRWKFHRVRIRR